MKKTLVFAFALCAALVSNASYLYWQTSTDQTFNDHEVSGYNIYATQGTSSSGGNLLTVTYTDGTAVSHDSGYYAKGGEYKIGLDDSYSTGNYSFYVEVIGYDSSVHTPGTVGVIGQTTTPMSYADLVSAGSIVPSGLTAIPTMWTGGTMSAPEPTSGLLMMVGLALLGLKRRKV